MCSRRGPPCWARMREGRQPFHLRVRLPVRCTATEFRCTADRTPCRITAEAAALMARRTAQVRTAMYGCRARALQRLIPFRGRRMRAEWTEATWVLATTKVEAIRDRTFIVSREHPRGSRIIRGQNLRRLRPPVIRAGDSRRTKATADRHRAPVADRIAVQRLRMTTARR